MESAINLKCCVLVLHDSAEFSDLSCPSTKFGLQFGFSKNCLSLMSGYLEVLALHHQDPHQAIFFYLT
jgi:hypothetical protein